MNMVSNDYLIGNHLMCVVELHSFFFYQASSFVISYFLVMQHYGRALRRLLKEAEEKTMTLEQFEKMIEV